MIETKSSRPRALSRFFRTTAIGMAALTLFAAPLAVATDDGFHDLVAAERRFASDAGRIGITAAFLAHVAHDGVLIRPEPGAATTLLAGQRDEPGDKLEWQPEVAAVARSNDLGFTMGPYRFHSRGKLFAGYFVTIWQRDADGRWRWYLDHGLPGREIADPAPLPVRVRRLRSSEAAAATPAPPDFAAAEDALNAALIRQGAGALASVLADDGQLLRPGHEPMRTADAGTLLDREPPVVTIERQGMRLSQAGDFAASYGRVNRGPGRRPAHYVRVWRLDAAGWRLLVDEVV